MKYCPKCQKQYPALDGFCNTDGSRLIPFSSQSAPSRSSRGRKLIYVFITIAFLVLLGVNMIPFGLKWAASNCKVTLQGIAIKGSTNVYKDLQDIFEEFKQVFSSGELSDTTDQDITLILAVKNNNVFPFALKSANVRLYVNNKQAASGRLPSDNNIKIGAREKTEIRLPLDISLRVIPSILMDNEIRCRAEGKVVIDTFIGEVEYPIDIEGVNLPVTMSGIQFGTEYYL